MSKTKRRAIKIGEKIGRLTVIRLIGKKTNGTKIYECKCECGNTKRVVGAELRRGHTQSCGCLFNEVQLKTVTKHGRSKSRIYKIWKGIKKRCTNPNAHCFKDYGGRGITICDEWKNDFQSFYYWAINNGYSKELSIDRIDVNGNYSPSNCRWATKKEQANNKRSNIIIEFEGKNYTIAELSQITGIKKSTLYSRVYRHRNRKNLDE